MITTQTCPKCKTEIHADATKCPACRSFVGGNKAAAKSAAESTIVAMVVIAVVILILFFIGGAVR